MLFGATAFSVHMKKTLH